MRLVAPYTRLAIVLMLVGFSVLFGSSTSASADAASLHGGFARLHDLLPDVVGEATSPVAYDVNGATQATTRGLLVWRRGDNWTGFTDGYRTWVIGPRGLQSRLNTEVFDWELGGVSAASAASEPFQPPTEVRISAIGLEWPVVPADHYHVPEHKRVGWYIGSGLPGEVGNMVLFGHNNGEHEVFSRLWELKPGDDIIVEAAHHAHAYTVRDSRIVPRTAVEVLAPTADHRLTIITCTGMYDPAINDYPERLIVTALLVGS